MLPLKTKGNITQDSAQWGLGLDRACQCYWTRKNYRLDCNFWHSQRRSGVWVALPSVTSHLVSQTDLLGVLPKGLQLRWLPDPSENVSQHAWSQWWRQNGLETLAEAKREASAGGDPSMMSPACSAQQWEGTAWLRGKETSFSFHFELGS